MFPTPAGTVYPLNVAPPSGTTRASLEITPNDSLIQVRLKTVAGKDVTNLKPSFMTPV